MLLSKWKPVLYGLIVVLGCVFAAPSFVPDKYLQAWPSWLPHKSIALGLDLKGGAQLILEIDTAALRKDQLIPLQSDTLDALKKAKVPCRTSIRELAVVVQCASDSTASDARDALAPKGARTVLPFAITTNGPEIALTPIESELTTRQAEAIQQSIAIISKRIDSIGVAESNVQKLGTDRILVQLPGVQDPSSIRSLLGSTAKLSFHRVREVTPSIGLPLPPGSIRLADVDGKMGYVLEAKPLLQGERLRDARASVDTQTGKPIVSFKLDGLGAKQFGEVTKENVGRAFAIVLDGKVLSAPVIQEPILGGSGQISGHFTQDETTSLAALLRAGALPVPLKVLDQGTVSAELGESSIRTGATTGVIGMGLVFVFMTVLYRAWGLVANLALIANVALTLALATYLGVTLTLPGIAGIVLGIGLAVDANVLINERIREETRAGRSAAMALQSGFKRAYSAILDSNLTTLIATMLLFSMGSGPVQGFAIMMALGIAISMFTAVTVVHAVMAMWVGTRRSTVFQIGSFLPKRWLGKAPNFAYMKGRYIGIGVSIVLSIASIALLIKPGLNLGVDFASGIMIEATLPQHADLDLLEKKLNLLDIGEVKPQRVSGSSTFIRIEQPRDADDSIRVKIADQARASILEEYPEARFGRVDVASSKISAETTDNGITAVIFACVAMFFYIWIRFEWHFAVGAIATLLLDVTKIMGFIAVTGLEFNMSAIAALLTMIGYSVNDKVVVYDRMRENIELYPEIPLRSIIDRSINETLARSLFTSATALLAMIPMAIWGDPSVESFAIPVVVGIVIAASSSVFIAAPILLFLGDWRSKTKALVSKDIPS